MSLAQRFAEMRDGFDPPFWVANFTEIFERVAYYGTTAVLAVYLTEQLHFSKVLALTIQGIAGFVVYAVSILAGTLADRFGFRRMLLVAYAVLSVGYFLLGSLGAIWMQPLRNAIGETWLVSLVLLIPSLGPGLVKPCVVGTTARASRENVRSLGYSIYYTLVNIGGAVGPLMAWLVRQKFGWGIENVFRVASLSVFLMFWVTLFIYREPGRDGQLRVETVSTALKNMFIVLGNLKFVSFLLISSGFYIVYWQIFTSAPVFIHQYVNPTAAFDGILSIEALTVICLQIAIAYMTRKLPAIQSIAIGFLIAGLSWIFLAVHPTIFTFGVQLVVLAIGEVTQAARYYEYCSRLAPEDQQGLYMGYAFLPIAIGYAIAGRLGGRLMTEFGDVLHRPNDMWWVIVAIGCVTAGLMWFYGAIVQPVNSSSTEN